MKKDKIIAITNVDNFNSSKGAIFLYVLDAFYLILHNNFDIIYCIQRHFEIKIIFTII